MIRITLIAALVAVMIALAPVAASAQRPAAPAALSLAAGAASVALPGKPEKMDEDTLAAMAPSFISLAMFRLLAEHPAAAQDLAPQMVEAVLSGEGWATPAGQPFFAVADFPAPKQIGLLELPLRCPTKAPDPEPGAPVISCHPFEGRGLAGLEVSGIQNGQTTSLSRLVAAGGRFYELLWQAGSPSPAGAAAARKFMESLRVK